MDQDEAELSEEELDAANRRELRRMERNAGLYAVTGVGFATGAYVGKGRPRLVLGTLATVALLASAWIGVWALGVRLLLRFARERE